MLTGIEFARRNDWPFLGTCGGFQYALIECARNVLGIKMPTPPKTIPARRTSLFIPWLVQCRTQERCAQTLRPDSRNSPPPRILPAIFLRAGQRYRRILLHFEVNPEYEWAAMEAGFPVVARERRVKSARLNRPRTALTLPRYFQPQHFLEARESRIRWFSLRASGRRLGQKKIGR